MYNFDGGPQGIVPLRQFLVDKLAANRGINTSIDEILITSGSDLEIELINEIVLQQGDTAIVEAFSFSGPLGNLRRRKVNNGDSSSSARMYARLYMEKSGAPPREWGQRYVNRHGVRYLRLTTAASRATGVTIRRTAVVKRPRSFRRNLYP